MKTLWKRYLSKITARSARRQAATAGLVIVDTDRIKRVAAVVARLRSRCPERRIVVLATEPDWRGARAALMAGALDYLPKSLGEKALQRIYAELRCKPLPPWPHC